ncbi:hypothetical protein ACHAWC_004295 [Mediolabrus comicus]
MLRSVVRSRCRGNSSHHYSTSTSTSAASSSIIHHRQHQHHKNTCRLIATTNPRFWDADNRSSQYGVFSSCSTHLTHSDSAKEDNNIDKLPSTSSSNAVGDNAQVNLQIPFQRSKKKSKNDNNELEIPNSFDDRAKAKLKALSTAKVNAEESKLAYLQLAKSNPTTVDNDNIHALHEQWKQSEEQLSHAYSQAIKYTSRILKNQKATQTAERLLFEWMDRFTNSFERSDGVISTKNDTNTAVPITLYMNKKRMIRTINKIVPKLTSSSNISSSASLLSKEINNLPKIHIPPPSEKDYMNILRAYSMSKAKRKGQQCETLLSNMLELAKTAAYYYSEDDKSWTEDRVHDMGMEVIKNDQNVVASSSEKRWIGWVTESIPKSKAFSIAIKCYAGTTQTESLERILLLNHIHDEFSKCCVPHVHGIYNDDPYVLFHSIKSLKNFQIKEERKLGEKWMQKLHKFVTSYENRGYLVTTPEVVADGEENGGTHYDDTQTNNTQTTIDVTSAYTTTIRLLAKLRGTKGVAADARNILDLMHKVHHVYEHGLKVEGDGSLEPPARIASIEIRPNAYNLVLGLYRDSKDEKDSMKAVDLLQTMVDAGSKPLEMRNGVPLPNEQSFEFAILALAHMTDRDKAIQVAELLLSLMDGQDFIQPSIDVHNAFLKLCIKQLHGTSELYDKAQDILNNLKQSHGLSPNSETIALVIKACSVSDRDDTEEVLAKATDLFSQLETQEVTENSALALTDGAYFHMMKCIHTYVNNDEVKKEKIEQLFSDACQRGMCSANVLSIFRNSVTEEEYRLTVGKGRLADKWIANVTSPLAQKVRYTDGTKGGKDKHARRKGKSTSNWKQKEATIQARKEEKKAKKFYNKL